MENDLRHHVRPSFSTMRKSFRFTDLIPDLDFKGWIGFLVGLFGSFLILAYVHYITVDERKKYKEANLILEHSKYKAENDPPEYELGKLSDASDQVSPKQSVKSPRYCFIDCARGLAICFVTFFHYIWNLRHNDVLPSEYKERDLHELFLQICEFWVYFGVCFIWLSETFHASVIAGYFGFALVTAVCIMWHYWAAQMSGVGIIMFCVGISSYVQNCHEIKWNKIYSRIKKLFLVSLSITIVTYIVMPHEFVYFGAIHCITLVSILHLPFLKYPQFSILGTVAIFSYKAFIGEFPLEVKVFRSTVDHMPWFENLGYLLLGVFSGYLGMHKASRYIRCMWGKFGPGMHLEDSVFPYLGRHSLFIFVAHQVVLFPLVKLLTGHGLFE